MAVVVQGLIPAKVSAVVFTKNPVSGRADELLINATWGLGEAIVSGAITPDTIVLDKTTLHMRSVLPGAKHLRIDPQPAGGTVVTAVDEVSEALDEAQVMALGALCRDVELVFGIPMDVEAAFAAGQWYLLQARPITTK
jgi:rifampicin phosphotransferase